MWMPKLIFWGSISALLAAIALLMIYVTWRAKEPLPTKIAIFIFAITLPVVSLSLYGHWGAWQPLTRYWVAQSQAQAVQQELARYKTPEQVVQRLQDFLKRHPRQAKGWYLLGKLHMDKADYTEAVLALANAHAYAPKRAAYTTAYAEALFFANDKRLNQQAQQLLFAIVQKEPHNINANNLLAIDAYNQAQYAKAIQYWERLLDIFPPQSRDAKMLYTMIARAQNALKGE